MGAEDDQSVRRGPYVRAFTGVGITRAAISGYDSQPSGRTLRSNGSPGSTGRYQPTGIGTRFHTLACAAAFFFRDPQWLSVSVEVLHFKSFAEDENAVRVRGTDEGVAVDTVAPMNRFVQQYQVSNGVNMLLGNVHAHKRVAKSSRFADGRVDVYAGVGAGVTFPFTRSVIDGESRGQYERGRPATQLLGGVAWRLSPGWDVAVEYKFTATIVDGSVANGDSESRLRTHHLVFGLGVHFTDE